MNNRVFAALFFSVFVSITGVGIVVPLLPGYVHRLGASGFYIGLVFGSFSLSRTLFLPLFGKLSDSKGRKPFIAGGLLVYALVSAAYVVFTDLGAFLVIRLVQGAASAMILPVAQAYVGDITPKGREGFVMGLFNVSLYASLSLGPVLGGVLKDRLNIEAAFLSMGVLAFLGFGLCVALLPSRGRESIARSTRVPVSFRSLARERDVLGLLGFRFAHSVCIGIVWAFLPIIGEVEFGLSSSSVGVLVMLGVLVSGVLQTPMGVVADRGNHVALVVSGGVLTAAALVSYGLASGFWGLFLSNAVLGVGGGFGMPAAMALGVSKGSATRAMGSVMALLTVGHSLGMLLGPVLGGVVMDLWGLGPAFVAGAVLMAGATLAFPLCVRPPRSARGSRRPETPLG